MTAVPPGAVTAAGNALRKRWEAGHPGIADIRVVTLDPVDWAVTALEAAAPLIAAAALTDGFIDGVATEKENIRQLALEKNAIYDEDPAAVGPHYAPFADLIAGDSP